MIYFDEMYSQPVLLDEELDSCLACMQIVPCWFVCLTCDSTCDFVPALAVGPLARVRHMRWHANTASKSQVKSKGKIQVDTAR